MKKFLKVFFVYSFFFYIVLNFVGCSEAPKTGTVPFLIKTQLMHVTVEEFLEELDLKKASYPYNIDEDPAEYNEMVISVVQMLSEEIVLLSSAKSLDVTISQQEIKSAEDEFKKDYPGESFEKILLENAISHSFWKKRFRKNLIIDKLIDQELRQKIKISSQDIVDFYKTYNKNTSFKKMENENELIESLRRQKAQDNYDEWIEKLKNEHIIEINKEKLKTLLLDIEKSEAGKNG